jgi:arabinofuranosyltransferase
MDTLVPLSRRAEVPLRGPEPARVRWNLVVVAGAALLIGLFGYLTRWVCDDALIFTRAVEQILAGNGPVFNVGERAESSTSALWQWLLVLAGFLFGQPDTSTISWVLGLLLTAGGFALAVDTTWRLHNPRRTAVLVPCGILVLLGFRPVWEYATSGLETGLTTFWLATCWWLLIRLRSGGSAKAILLAAFTIGLGPLVRPDLALVAAVFLAALWLVVRPGRRLTLGAAGAAAGLPIAYEIFRMGFYGIVVPMPALTKNADASMWGPGFAYLADLAGPTLLVLPLVLVIAVSVPLLRRLRGRRTDQVVTLAPVAAGLLHLVYVVKVGGDYMHARMALPALFLILLPILVVPRSKRVGVAALVVVVWAAVFGGFVRYPGVAGSARGVDDERAYYTGWTGNAHPADSSDYIPKLQGLKDAVAAEVNSGQRSLIYQGTAPGLDNVITTPLRADVPGKVLIVGVYLGTVGMLAPTDVGVVDFWGLANPIGARFSFPTVKPGHSKPLGNAWLLAGYADPAAPLDPSGNFMVRNDVTPQQVAAARHALSCGDLAEIQRSTREPLSFKRFWDNLTGAWHRTQVTIPPDPFEAERTFCGRP